MPYASVTYTATNGQTVFGPVTFPGGAALQSSHIKVYLNGSLVTTATVSGSLSAPSVTLASGATAGDNVRIERQTPTTAATRLVDFEDGDVLTASDLDTAMLNNLYVAQEANDVGANGLPLDPVNNVWNAGGRKIVGGVNPSASTDFATKGYVDSVAFGPSSGTVTSVGLTMPSIFTVSNSPILSSGDLNVGFSKFDQNKVLAAPSNGAGIPDFRVLAAADIPNLTASKITDFNTTVRTNRLDQMAAPTGSVGMGSQLVTSVATPVNASDAATKGYVDSKGFMDWTPNAITPTIVSNLTVQVECRLTNSVNSRLNTINWTSGASAFNGDSGQNWFRINNNTGQTVTLLLLHSTMKWDLAGASNCANPSPVPFPWSTLDTVNYTNAGGLITLTNGSFHYFKSLSPLGSEWGNSPYNNFAQGVAGEQASWIMWFLRLS
jgi:hypothetical protein